MVSTLPQLGHVPRSRLRPRRCCGIRRCSGDGPCNRLHPMTQIPPPPLVEALVGWNPTLDIAQVPFPVAGRGLADIRQQFGDRVPPRRHPVVASRARQRHLVCARPRRHTSGHEDAPRRSALRLGVEVRQTHTLFSQNIEPGRGYLAAISTQVTPADVVGEHEDDVRMLRHRV